MRALAALLVLFLVAPALAQEKSDATKEEETRAENHLLKKARRLAADGDKPAALQAYIELEALAAQHKNAAMEATALDEARAVAPDEATEARLSSSLGHVYMTENEHVKSVKAYRRACKLDPENTSLWNSLGYSLHLAGNEEESVQAFERCLELDKGNKEARYSLAVSYRLSGKPEKALEEDEWLLAHEDELAIGWYFAFESAAKKKTAKGLDMTSLESRKAMVALEVAIDQVFLDDIEPAEKTIARLKEKLAASDLEPALDVAIDETARALEIRPEHHQLHYLLGLLHEARGEDAEAKAHFEKFVEADKRVHPLAKKAKEKLASDEKK